MRTDRLRMLADHLINGKLHHKVFDYSIWNSPPGDVVPDGSPLEVFCGTNGCAIGEMPFIDRENWAFMHSSEGPLQTPHYFPHLKGSLTVLNPAYGAAFYFEITHEESAFLFSPFMSGVGDFPLTHPFEGRRPHDISARDVGELILDFIRLKEEIDDVNKKVDDVNNVEELVQERELVGVN